MSDMQEIGFQSSENQKFSWGSMPPDPSRTLVALLLNRRLSNFSPSYAPLICLKPMISRRRLFTILRLNYIVNQATLIKVKDRCAKFTSRLPSLISPKHLKTWSNYLKNLVKASGHSPNIDHFATSLIVITLPYTFCHALIVL